MRRNASVEKLHDHIHQPAAASLAVVALGDAQDVVEESQQPVVDLVVGLDVLGFGLVGDGIVVWRVVRHFAAHSRLAEIRSAEGALVAAGEASCRRVSAHARRWAGQRAAANLSRHVI